MGKDSIYYKEKEKKELESLRKLEKILPTLCKEMLDFKAERGTAVSTRVSYCYDLRCFFRWYYRRDDAVVTTNEKMNYKALESIPRVVFEDFKKYLADGDENEHHASSGKGIDRRLAALKNLYKYHIAEGHIENNPVQMVFVQREARKDHTIIRLTRDEVEKLLKANRKLTIFKRGRQRTYKKMTQQRDGAMLVLLLNTGLRISELVGLDMTDVDLKENKVTVVRKGGFVDEIYFNSAVSIVLKKYLKCERKEIAENKVIDKNELNAFFLSIQGKRWSADSIERTVRQYCERVIPYKHITPHKLRATYGSILYSETGDIRLVADVLGHENINTTIKYYAAKSDERKRQAADQICLMLGDDNSLCTPRKKGKKPDTESTKKTGRVKQEVKNTKELESMIENIASSVDKPNILEPAANKSNIKNKKIIEFSSFIKK